MKTRATSRPKAWFDDDSFWTLLKPFMFDERKWLGAEQDAPLLEQLLGLEPGAKVLDLCCGPGRFTLALARRGFRVTGVDRTRGYLAEARKRARAQKLAVELVHSDMRRFSRPGAFDAGISMFTSFGYFKKPEDDLAVCRNVCKSLRPGGSFLIQVGGKEWLAREFRPRDWNEFGGNILLEERTVAPGWTGLDNRWILVSKGRRHEFRFYLRLYSAAELAGLLKLAGFRRAEVYGDLSGRPYDNTSRWLVAVGRK